MLYSLYSVTKEDITVYFLNYRVDSEDFISFSNLMKQRCKIDVINVNVADIDFSQFPIGYHLSIETYFRILAQFILPNSIDRILWLDGDIVVLQDIHDFYYQDFEEKAYVVCRERTNDTEDIINLKKKLGLPESHVYFNAGVMLINLNLLRQTTEMSELLKKCNELKEKVQWFDQDILNCIYEKQLKYDDAQKYNYQLRYDTKIPSKLLREVHILHYNSEFKPWNYQQMNSASIYYWCNKSKLSKEDNASCKLIIKCKIKELVSDLFSFTRGLIKMYFR